MKTDRTDGYKGDIYVAFTSRVGRSLDRSSARALRLCCLVLGPLVFILLSSAGPVRAQAPISGIASVDRATVTLGDRITFTITVHLPPGTQITPLGDTQAFGPFDILERHAPQERTLGDGQRELTMTFVVAAFRATGKLALPELVMPYQQADGSRGLVRIPAVAITVHSVLPDQPPPDIRDLKPQLTVPGAPSRAPYYGAAAGAAAVVALLGGILVWRLRRAKPPVVAPTLPLLPEDVARSELDRIAALNLLEKGDVCTYHQLLARVIRRYLSDRYTFPAFAMTTTELEAQMVGRGVDRWQARLAFGLLRECDAVVYAGYRPAYARADGNLTTAYEIVELTRPAPLMLMAPSRNGERMTA